MELSGKVSIITGASSGLGQATAVLFARKGAMITLCGRDQDRLKAVLDQCTQASGGHQERFITVQGDVTEASARQEIVDKTIKAFGRLDILVANAAVAGINTNIWEATEEIFDHTFNVNVKATFFLVQAALPYLEASKGNVICTSSILGTITYSHLVYPMTKAALDHMTRCLALDLGPKGIRVNAVKPSFIPGTRLGRGVPQSLLHLLESFEKTETGQHPLNNQLTTPEGVAETVCFLASDAAKFITGQCLLIDGGRSQTGPFMFGVS